MWMLHRRSSKRVYSRGTVEIEQLRYFVAVAEHGSFSRAAASLGMSQPLLSRKVRALEVELHRNLLYRNGRGASVTEAGERFLVTARNVLHEIDMSMQVTVAQDAELTGRFVLGLTPSLARILTVPIVRAFSARFPKARLSMVEGLSRELHDRLLTDRVDAAVLHDQPSSPLVEAELLSLQALCLITRRGALGPDRQAIAFTELQGLPLIFPSAPHPLRAIVEQQALRQGITLDIAYDIDGVETILELVHEGFGHNVASANVVRGGPWSQSLMMIPIVEPAVTTTLSLVTSRRHPPTALHRLTLGVIREAVRSIL